MPSAPVRPAEVASLAHEAASWITPLLANGEGKCALGEHFLVAQIKLGQLSSAKVLSSAVLPLDEFHHQVLVYNSAGDRFAGLFLRSRREYSTGRLTVLRAARSRLAEALDHAIDLADARLAGEDPISATLVHVAVLHLAVLWCQSPSSSFTIVVAPYPPQFRLYEVLDEAEFIERLVAVSQRRIEERK